MRSRDRSSSQMLTPAADSAASGLVFFIVLFLLLVNCLDGCLSDCLSDSDCCERLFGRGYGVLGRDAELAEQRLVVG